MRSILSMSEMTRTDRVRCYSRSSSSLFTGLAVIRLLGMAVRATLLSVPETSRDRLLHISTHPSMLPGRLCT